MAFTTTSAFAFDVGMGFDRETKYKNDKGTSTNYNYVFIENKWKNLGGVKTKFTHYKNMETDVTKHNELKISKDFKFSIVVILTIHLRFPHSSREGGMVKVVLVTRSKTTLLSNLNIHSKR